MTAHRPRGALAWALYDLANTIYSMNVVSLFFSQWVTVDQGREDMWYSVFYGGSMALVALTLPYLGLWSDRGGSRKQFLGVFTLIAVSATAALGWLTQLPGLNGLILSLSVFAISNYAFQGGLVFYNALLPEVSTESNRGRVSGFGVGLGYVGSFIGMFTVLPFVEGTLPFLNLEVPWITPGGRTAAFLPTAVLFGVFAIPLFLRVRERPRPRGGPPTWTEAFRDLTRTLADTRRYPGVGWFLLANLLILDSVHTAIVFMAVYAQKVLGLPDSAKVVFFMLATIPAIAGSYVAGRLADRIGPRRVFIATAWGWAICSFLVSTLTSIQLFYVVGGIIGALLGSLWASSRPLLLTLVPAGEEGRAFGLYAFCNKAAAIVGPMVWGFTVLLGESLGPAKYRLAVALLGVICAMGALLMRRVPERREAAA
jgi:UMF1 family MFS transporter